jgi:tetratricopeptide (TPR) repeat protein
MSLTRLFSLLLFLLGICDLQGTGLNDNKHAHPETGSKPADESSLTKPVAPILGGLGTWNFTVTTASPRAQQFFNQGIRLVYAFNHAEAVRAFQEAARLDASFAMAAWGEALALGPNINAPLSAEGHTQAYTAIQKAISLKAKATEKERALIEALAVRYSADTKAERAPFDLAYANAMRKVAARFPEDGDVQTVFAAAVMDTMPWNYWNKDGSPREGTNEAIKVLEAVIARHPEHPGAHHFYIHMVEASATPDRAVRSADVLADLMPGAGHMVHMPSHIYLRVGRYADASASNERAIVADEEYLSQCQAQGMYPVGYYPHNVHFLWFASSFEGRSAQAIDAARKTAEKVPHHVSAHTGSMHDLPIVPIYAYVRFGKWQDILTTPKPADSMDYPLAIWHYARALAFVARGQVDRAKAESKALEGVAAREVFRQELKDTPLLGNLEIAMRIVRGEIAAERGDFATAIGQLTEAVKLQDDQSYMEPAYWHYPVRHTLGAVLLEAGRPLEAEQVYRDDLKRNRENGWSLFGLMQSLDAQKKSDELSTVAARFRKAWARADVTLTASRF